MMVEFSWLNFHFPPFLMIPMIPWRFQPVFWRHGTEAGLPGGAGRRKAGGRGNASRSPGKKNGGKNPFGE
jgi:hypothetical protein